MKTSTAYAPLLIAAVLAIVPTAGAQNAGSYFTAGTNALAASNIVSANTDFSNAVSLSGININDTYNLFYAATEVLVLPNQPAGSNFLTRLGFESTGRDIFEWKAKPTKNTKGNLVIPARTPPLNADEFTAQLRTNILPAIISAESNLAQITNANFTADLTTNETHAAAVTLDWGDVQMLQAMGYAAELYIYETHSANLDVQLASATNFFGEKGSLETFLADYPGLLATTSTADLPAAQSAFSNAINTYFAASQFIRNRPPDETRLFNLDTNKLQEELHFRGTLSNLLASLSGPVTLTTSPDNTVSAQAFFGGNFDLRSYLPELQGSDFVWDTFSDPTFGGIITGLTEKGIGKTFLKKLESVLDLTNTSLSVLYNFTNYSGQTGVVQGPSGTLYGTTVFGGSHGYGSIFKVTTSGQLSTLYSFGKQPNGDGYPFDGAYPNAVVLGSDGNLYGATQQGGLNQNGTIFRISTSGQFFNFYNFGASPDKDANVPAAALVQGSDGRLYGTTSQGGDGEGGGAGTVFAVSTNGVLTNLYSFSGDNDGGNPAGAPLVQGIDGNIYGVTPEGGNFGYGTIFEINLSQPGQISTLYSFGTLQDDFGDPLDGALPNGLVQGANGDFYGTTQYGGTNDDELGFDDGSYSTGNFQDDGDGTLFRFSPTNANSFTSLLSFDENFSDGYNPIGSLLPGTNGVFYGVASAGGVNKRGVVFILNANGTATNLVWLTKTSGSYGGNFQSLLNDQLSYDIVGVPSFLAQGMDGNFYGTTTDNGSNGNGTIYILNATNNPGPLGVTLTAPINGQTFTAPASITLGALVTGGNLETTVDFYNGPNLLGQSTAAPYSITVANLGAGNFTFTAVASNLNGLTATSAVVDVTVTIPGTTLIDFDILNASAGPVSGAALSNYLAGFGVTVSNVTGGATLAVQEDQNIFNGTVTAAYSEPNLLTQIGNNGAISYTLVFNQPYTSVSWERTALLAGNGGVVAPSWTAYAYDGNGNAIGQVGENQVFSPNNMPAASFTLSGSNIASITFAANNNIGDLDSLPLDNLLLSTNALTNPLPAITLTAGNVVSNAPGQITLNAQASESGGTISSIAFYENMAFIGSPALTVNGTNATASLTATSLAPGAYTYYAVATDANGAVSSSTNLSLTVTGVPGVAVINFDNTSLLDTSVGAVGGAALSNYLAGFGVTISKATLGTRLEAVNQDSFSGNELPVPSSLPNLFTQVGSSLPVTFTLDFATNQQSFSFTRVGMNTNGPSGISHPAWSAHILDGSGNELESVSEPLLFSMNDIPPRTFNLVGNNIASVRFDSDSQQTAAFAAVLLDDLVLDANAEASPFSIHLTSPSGGAVFPAPTNIQLSATATDSFTNIDHVAFYFGPALIGSVSNSPYNLTWSNVLNGTYTLTAQVVDVAGYAEDSAPVTITVQPGGNTLAVNFDALNATGGPVTGAALSNYLATNGMMSVAGNSAGSSVAVENQANVAGGGFVSLTSVPNLLTETGSNGPASFTVAFSNLLTQFSFTRPELTANPFVTHPAWQATIFDPLGDVLASVQAPPISSYTTVPAQTYTLTGGSIASVEFDSDGTGLFTFNAALLDDFVLTTGNAGNLPPSVLITNPVAGQIFTNASPILIGAATAPGAVSGTITNVNFFYGGTNLAGSAQTSPFSILWTAPSNGSYVLTAVAANDSGLGSTSAPVSITVASNFAIVTPPLSQTIGVGDDATFTVTATETNVTYQWQTNGVAIPGATLSAYAISNAPLSAAGSYTVVVSNGDLSITSQPPAVLTVVSPPTINSTSPLQPVVNIGDTVTLSVNASDAFPFYYQWQLNGTGIAGATNSSFTISNAQPFDSGAYEVLVANTVASQESPIFSVSVGFGGAPTTTNDTFASSIPINPLVGPVEGINSNSPANGELAQIAGKPAGQFLWYNWTASFTGVISLTTRGSSFDTLLGVYTGSKVNALTPVAQDDDSGGFFTSLVSFNCQQGITYQIAVAGYKGAAGNVVLGLPSGTGYRVLDPNSGDAVPVITQQPSNQIVNVGDTVTLSVTASNAASYQWFLGGAPVGGVNTNMLVISNFPAGAVGNYTVLAVNPVGAAQSAAAIVQIAGQNNNGATNAPDKLTVDKFGDAVDLTGVNTPFRYRPADGGGDTGGFSLSQSFSTAGATKEQGEPNHAGQPGGASYWYSYTAPGNGTLHLDTDGSTFNTILAAYTGPGNSFSTLVSVGAAYTTNYQQQGQPAVVVSNVTAGTIFYIAIDGYLGASGAANLNVLLTNLTSSIITNTGVVVAITSPANNSLTTNPVLTIKGTVKSTAGIMLDSTSMQVAINSNAPVPATLGAITTGHVLVHDEEVIQQSAPWSITFSNAILLPGANLITAQYVSTNTGTASTPVIYTLFYDLIPPSLPIKSKLTLLVSPTNHGKITGQANQASLEIGQVFHITAAPVGNWVFTNWTSGTNANNLSPLPNGPSLYFLMSSNLVFQANFVTNPFTAVAGAYNGLFYPASGVTEDSSGFFTATIPASSSGAYTAKLLLNGGSYPFSGTFDLTGASQNIVSLSAFDSITVNLQLNLAAPDDQMTGTIVNNITNSWTSLLQADRAVFNAQTDPAVNYAGKYTLIIPPGNNAPASQPGGYGYASLTNTLAGVVSLGGQLGDGSSFSQSVPVSQDGNIPLYASLYSGQGSLLGWLTLTNVPPQTVLGSNLSWIKVFGKPGTLYADGFTNTDITILGSLYVPPPTGSNALALTNGTLTISNGNLVLTYNDLMVARDNLTNQNELGNPTNLLTGVVTPATGVLTVTFRPTSVKTNAVAKGVILQDDSPTNAAGWFFLGTNQTGSFLLQQ